MLWIYRTRILAVVIALLTVAFFVRFGPRPSLFERAVSLTFSFAGKQVKNTLLPYGNKETLKKQLFESNARRSELERENSRLTAELERLGYEKSAARPPGSILARIVSRDPASWLRRVTISAGTRDGVKKGFVATSEGGLAGRVESCGAKNCIVRLLSDPGAAASCMILPKGVSAIDAHVVKNPTYCISYGNAGETLDIVVVAGGAAARPGDRVFTTGLGGAYPKWLFIGTLSDGGNSRAFGSQAIGARPGADFKNLKYLFISQP